MSQLYARVDSTLRALVLLLGCWAIYANVGVFARVPFTTLRLFSFLPLLSAALLFRITTQTWQPRDVPSANAPAARLPRWLENPLVRFGAPLALSGLFFLTRSEWVFWIPAALWLTCEVWFTSLPQQVGELPNANVNSPWETVVLICLCLAAAAATSGLMRPDIDDAYYVNVATSVNEFPDRAPLSFDAMHRSGLPPVEQTLHLPQTYEVLVGLVSGITKIPVPTLYYLVFPPLWAVFGTLAHWLVLRHLLPRREALLAAAIWIFIILFWGDGIRTFGGFGFARIFQGKTIFIVVLVPLIVLMALRYRQRPGVATWVCLALGECAASALTTNGIVIAPVAAMLAIAARPRFDRAYIRALAGGLSCSLPILIVALLMHARLAPFLSGADPDPYFRPYLATLGAVRTPLVLLSIMALPVLAARARLACADWIRGYVWTVVIVIFVPIASGLATLVLGNVFSWRIFWSVPVPLLVSLAGGISLGAILDRRLMPEGAITAWLLAFAIAAPTTFAEGGLSFRNFGRLKVYDGRYAAAQATLAVARTDAPALVTEAVAMYLVGMPGAPPLVGVRRLYLRKLWHLIPDAELARRLELLNYVARGDRGIPLGDELEEITRSLGGDPFLPFESAVKDMEAVGVATVAFRQDHPDGSALVKYLEQRGFIIHQAGGFVVAALPKS